MNDLKPCPFCGAPMNLGPNHELVAWHSTDCFFILLEDDEVDMTEEELRDTFIAAWNRRINETPREDENGRITHD